jgi:type II secretory pathway pseudopilin PulG
MKKYFLKRYKVLDAWAAGIFLISADRAPQAYISVRAEQRARKIKKAPSSKRQVGAMFGMDARIALIIMAILAGVGGWQMMSRLESQKMDTAEAQANLLRDGIAKYYATVGLNRLPETLEELFQQGIITDPSLRKDPWGQGWEYYHGKTEVRVEDTPLTMQLAVVFSRGKNALDDTSGFNSAEEFAAWEVQKDDVGAKYTSREEDLRRLTDYQEQAGRIIDRLENSETVGFLEAQMACDGNDAPPWCAGVNGKNWQQFNFYPKTDADSTAGVVYYQADILQKKTFTSGNLEDMQELMVELGLPVATAQDPWGRVLQLNTNMTARTEPPFSASLCFSEGENCLTKRE